MALINNKKIGSLCVYYTLFFLRGMPHPAGSYPASNHMLKINNRNAREKSEICSKSTIKTPARGQSRHSDVFIVSFKHISHLQTLF